MHMQQDSRRGNNPAFPSHRHGSPQPGADGRGFSVRHAGEQRSVGLSCTSVVRLAADATAIVCRPLNCAVGRKETRPCTAMVQQEMRTCSSAG